MSDYTPEPLKEGSTPMQLMREDMKCVDHMLSKLNTMWKDVVNIKQATQLSNATLKILTERRKLLCAPYGDSRQKDAEQSFILPLD